MNRNKPKGLMREMNNNNNKVQFELHVK